MSCFFINFKSPLFWHYSTVTLYIHLFPSTQPWRANVNPNSPNIYIFYLLFSEDQLPPGFPTIDMGPQLKVVERTRTATMLCAASGNPDPDISWFKDFLPVNTTNNNGRIKQLRSGRSCRAESLITERSLLSCFFYLICFPLVSSVLSSSSSAHDLTSYLAFLKFCRYWHCLYYLLSFHFLYTPVCVVCICVSPFCLPVLSWPVGTVSPLCFCWLLH